MARFRETVAAAVLVCAAVLITPAHSAAAGPPQITASWVESESVSTTGARLRADINGNGLPTTFHFEYISDAAYQANPEGNRFLGAVVTAETKLGGQPASQELNVFNSDLTPSTAYHYRPVAKNGDGTTVGEGELEHVFVTKSGGATLLLPDNRAWEMVSPVDKGGGAIAPPEELFGGGDLQAGASPGSVTYGSGTAFGEAAGAPPVSQYVSHREPSAWVTENVSPPLRSAAYGNRPDGAPYRVFSADLSRSLLFGGLACRGGLEGCPDPNQPLAGSGAPAGYMAYYLRQGGQFSSLLREADVAHSAVSAPQFEVSFAAASPDLSHVVLSSCAALTEDATETPAGPGECDSEAQNLYGASAGALKAVNLLPGDSVGTPGAAVAAPSGAISADGVRVYWTEGGDLYLREGAQTVAVDAAVGGGGTFQTASADGSVAFFTKAGHLYRFGAIGKSTSDLTPAGGVLGVLGASADGGYTYFQDAAGLEFWHGGTTVPVAEGGPGTTLPSDYPPATATARVSADGLHLAFLSKAALTEFDNIDAITKQPDTELYVYSATAAGADPSLICASCNPTGERPKGSAAIPGALVNGSTSVYRPRSMSADGSRLFFETDDNLSENDSNGIDVYEWEARGAGGCQSAFGCVAPISNVVGDGGRFIDASADATDVFFLTGDSLVKADPGSIDLYDARVDGGLPAPQEPIVCVGDGCQSLPSEPEDPTPGTLVPNPGNPPLRIFGPKKKPKLRRGHHRSHRHRGGKHRGSGRAGGRGR